MQGHLYLFSDACPTDWLVHGQDDVWHTIANFVWQSAPQLQTAIADGYSHEQVLPQDPLFLATISALEKQLPSNSLRKWSSGSEYKRKFSEAFCAIQRSHRVVVSALSFQEKTLRASQEALLNAYNENIGGPEGPDAWNRVFHHSFPIIPGSARDGKPRSFLLCF